MKPTPPADAAPTLSGAAQDPFAEVDAHLAGIARGGEHWLGSYARHKLRMDSIYREVLPWIPAHARVLDLGCGVGLLGLLLEARGLNNSLHGIEWDAAKARFAQQHASANPTVRVDCADLFDAVWPACEVVVLLDVLHYFPIERQRALLLRIGAHLPEGGHLLLRVMDGRAVGLARFTRLCERVAVAFGWNRAARVHWRPLSGAQADLQAAGLVILPGAVQENHQALGNQFLVGEKRPGLNPA